MGTTDTIPSYEITVTYSLTRDAQRTEALAGRPAEATRTVLIHVPRAEALAWPRARLNDDGGYVRPDWIDRLASYAHLDVARHARSQSGAVQRESAYEHVVSAIESDLILTEDMALAIVRQRAARVVAVIAEQTVLAAEYREQQKRLQSEDAARREVERVEEERRHTEAAAEKVREWAAVESWVRDHGSARLRLALQAGMLDDSINVYRDERLALERPGWQWVDTSVEEGTRRNPSEAELRYLLDAREADPTVTLVTLRETYEDEEPGEWRPALLADYEAPRIDRQICRYLTE